MGHKTRHCFRSVVGLLIVVVVGNVLPGWLLVATLGGYYPIEMVRAVLFWHTLASVFLIGPGVSGGVAVATWGLPRRKVYRFSAVLAAITVFVGLVPFWSEAYSQLYGVVGLKWLCLAQGMRLAAALGWIAFGAAVSIKGRVA